jgi:hypothetical protein
MKVEEVLYEKGHFVSETYLHITFAGMKLNRSFIKSPVNA